jgi:hypothetical protein
VPPAYIFLAINEHKSLSAGLFLNTDDSRLYPANTVETCALSQVFADKPTTFHLLNAQTSPMHLGLTSFHERAAQRAFKQVYAFFKSPFYLVTDFTNSQIKVENNPDTRIRDHLICAGHSVFNILYYASNPRACLTYNNEFLHPVQMFKRLQSLPLDEFHCTFDVSFLDNASGLFFKRKRVAECESLFMKNRRVLVSVYGINIARYELLYKFLNYIFDIFMMFRCEVMTQNEVKRLTDITAALKFYQFGIHLSNILHSLDIYLMVCSNTLFPPPLLIITVLISYSLLGYVKIIEENLDTQRFFHILRLFMTNGAEITVNLKLYSKMSFKLSPLPPRLMINPFTSFSPSKNVPHVADLLLFEHKFTEMYPHQCEIIVDELLNNELDCNLLRLKRSLIGLTLFLRTRQQNNNFTFFDINFYSVKFSNDLDVDNNVEVFQILQECNDFLKKKTLK